jgi:hypothetical protein
VGQLWSSYDTVCSAPADSDLRIRYVMQCSLGIVMASRYSNMALGDYSVYINVMPRTGVFRVLCPLRFIRMSTGNNISCAVTPYSRRNVLLPPCKQVIISRR